MAESAPANTCEKFRAMNKSAFVLGYTGETGKALVKQLAESDIFSKVVLIGRREVQYEDEKLKKFEQRIVDFDKIDEYKDAFQGLDVGFCCLGTTRGKAGKDGFVKVDRDYVVNSANIAKEAGCEHFNLLTSGGSNPNSWFLYPKTKGEAEEALKSLKFPRLSIYRPAMLLCDREEKRTGEKAILAVLRPFIAASPTSISVPVESVARSMLSSVVAETTDPVQTFSNKTIHDMSAAWLKQNSPQEPEPAKADG